MERLTDKDTNKVCFDTWELCGLDAVCKRDCHKPTPCKIPKIIRRLAELEDKLESGQLVELPQILQWFADTELCQVLYVDDGRICLTKTMTKSQAETRLKELQEE